MTHTQLEDLNSRTTYYTGEDGRRRVVVFEEDYKALYAEVQKETSKKHHEPPVT